MPEGVGPLRSTMTENPYGSDSYKRAVYLPAPKRFAIKFLEPAKQGHGYSFGMRITAMNGGDRSSTSSTRGLTEYDIWRRWEDCLWFQDALEQEYSRRAREKKQRLLRGKGVKKNGFYLQDRASSFESLPPGPHPDSVAQDIHEHIPRLTKKGTVFRASQATINQRDTELRALVEGLLRDDLPSLVKEICATNVVTDFFGYWRRDFDLYESAHKRDPGSPPKSIISWSTNCSSILRSDASSRSSQDVSSVSTKMRSPTTSDTQSQPSTSDMIRLRYYPGKDRSTTSFFSRSTSRTRTLSMASTDSSSSGSDRSSVTSIASSVPATIEEGSITVGHSLHQNPDQNLYGTPHSALQALPEDQEVDVKADSLALMSSAAVKRRRRSAAAHLYLNRSRGPASPPRSPTRSELTAVPEQDQSADETYPDPPMREPRMSTASAATYLQDLGLSLPPEPSNRASILTVMTTDSAEGALGWRPPSRSLPSSPARSGCITPSSQPRFSQAVSLSDYDIWADLDEDGNASDAWPGGLTTARTDAFPRPISFADSLLELRPESPLGYREGSTPIVPEKPLPSFFLSAPSSPTGSTASGPVTASPEGTISIKAALNQSIVALRVSRLIGYEELRVRLYDKFVIQEGLPLSRLFAIAVTNPSRQTTGGGRARSGSVTSADYMEFVGSQSDWARVVTSCVGGKLTLRILDTAS